MGGLLLREILKVVVAERLQNTGHFIYMCRYALKNEEYNSSFYSYSMRYGNNKWLGVPEFRC